MLQSFRAVSVYKSPLGEMHQRLGFYTEEGMIYTTIYGAKKSKDLSKRALSLFVMGTICVEKRGSNRIDFKTIDVYSNAEGLSQHLPSYYASCLCAELVRFLIGAEHKEQFKVLVDTLLYFLENKGRNWKEALVLFLWKSLRYNGWQPELPASSKTNDFWEMDTAGMLRLIQHKAKKDIIEKEETEKADTVFQKHIEKYVFSPELMTTLKKCTQLCSKDCIHSLVQIPRLHSFILFLVLFWQQHLERKINTFQYLASVL